MKNGHGKKGHCKKDTAKKDSKLDINALTLLALIYQSFSEMSNFNQESALRTYANRTNLAPIC